MKIERIEKIFLDKKVAEIEENSAYVKEWEEMKEPYRFVFPYEAARIGWRLCGDFMMHEDNWKNSYLDRLIIAGDYYVQHEITHSGYGVHGQPELEIYTNFISIKSPRGWGAMAAIYAAGYINGARDQKAKQRAKRAKAAGKM